MNNYERNFLKYYESVMNEEENERKRFSTHITLTLNDLEELMVVVKESKLKHKLKLAYVNALHEFNMRNVDFGDLKED